MKKILSLLAAGLLGLSAIPIAASASTMTVDEFNEYYKEIVDEYFGGKGFSATGDVNLDGVTDSVDCCQILAFYSESVNGKSHSEEEFEFFREHGDMNGDGMIDSLDASFALTVYAHSFNLTQEEIQTEMKEKLN